MTDVESGGKSTPKTGGTQGSDAVGQQRRASLITVAGGFSAFQILKRPNHREQAHGKDNAQKLPSHRRGQAVDQWANRWGEHIGMKLKRLRGELKGSLAGGPQYPGDRSSQQDRHKANR